MKLLTSDSDSIRSNSTDKNVLCHLSNNNDVKKYYSEVSGKIKANEEKCVTECHSKCKICWAADNCVPVCQKSKEYKIDGFMPVDCTRPFYFCSSELSVNTVRIGRNTVGKKFHGTS